MTHRTNTVVPKAQCPTEEQFHNLVIAGLARVSTKVGRGAVAQQMGRTTRALDKVFAGSTPEAKALFDLLGSKETITALDEVLATYGVRLAPLHANADNDMHTAADLAKAAGSLMDALSDGKRDHLETLTLGTMFRELLPKIAAIVSEADAIRNGGIAA